MIKKSIYKFRHLIPLVVLAIIAFCYFYFPKLASSERITLISAIVVTGSLIYTLITIEGNERTFTYNICADWYKTDLNKYHVNIFYFTSDVEINTLIEKFIAGNLTEPDEVKFQKMVSLLNYFQMIATFYLSEKVDKTIVRDNFKHIIIKYYAKFDKVINHVNSNENKPLLELKQLYKIFNPTDKR